MEKVFEKISEDGRKKVSIYYDTDASNPRECINYSHIICDHPRYFLGDGDHLNCPSVLRTLCDDYDIDWERDGDEMSNGEMFDELSQHIVIHPVSVYDHSGITIFYGNYKNRWDTNCIGFGYVEKSDVERLQPINKDTDWRAIAIDIMSIEMQVYDRYIRGDVYRYVLEELNDKSRWEETDSCGGYYEEPEELANMILND